MEEDQDASDDEDEKRIRFSGVKNKTQRQKIAEEIGIIVKCALCISSQNSLVRQHAAVPCAGIEGSDDEALDTGQDEEVSRWEQEQIRKGISIPQVSRGLNCTFSSLPRCVDCESIILLPLIRSRAASPKTTWSTIRTVTRVNPTGLPTACR